MTRGPAGTRLLAVLAMLALAELAAPVESPVAEPLAELIGPSAAAAQTPTAQFVDGTPDPCPTDPEAWSASGDGSVCELTMDACLASPVSGGYLNPLRALDGSVSADHDLLVELKLDGLDDEERETLCYETFLKSDDSRLYDACVSNRGRPTGADPDERCTLIQAARCPSPRLARTRTGLTECRGIERRSWKCPDGYKPRNAFNQCYRLRPAASIPGDHPACDNSKGAPDFTVVDCRDYVAGDYLENPASADCADIYEAPDARLPRERYELMERIGHDGSPSRHFLLLPVALEPVDGESGRYWCRFNPNWLSLECHILRSPACLGVGAAPALCLKRASETGGCNAIARTILCRWYQAVYASEINHFQTRQSHRDPANHPVQTPRLSRKRAEARQAGCNPCPRLPFDSMPFQSPLKSPPASPALRARLPRLADLVENGRSDRIGAFCDDSNPIPDAGCPAGTPRHACKQTILDRQRDIDPPDLHMTPELRCSKPPEPRIRFTSGHPSGQALVNSPVRVELVAASGGGRRGDDDGSYVEFKGYTVKFGLINSEKISRREIVLRWSEEVERYMKLVRTPSSTATVDPKSGEEWSRIPLSDPAAGFCVTGLPQVQLRVEELWPDNPGDHGIMKAEFGPEAVEWWDDLEPDQRSAVTSARGLAHWSTAPRSARRPRELTEEVGGCSYNPLWCNWEPTRPGYYRLTAETAWTLTPTTGVVAGGTVKDDPDRRCVRTIDHSRETDGFYENCGFGPVVLVVDGIPDRYVGLGALRCYLHRASQDKRLRAPGETVTVWDHVNNLVKSLGLKPRDLGFKDDLSDLLPWHDDMDTPCTHDALGGSGKQPQAHYLADIRCPTLDLRITCTASPDLQGRYVESEPLYMMVSEVRANTRTPS